MPLGSSVFPLEIKNASRFTNAVSMWGYEFEGDEFEIV